MNSVVAGTVVKPAISRVAAQAATAADGPLAQHLDALRWSPRWSFGGDLITANDAAMLYVMTMKPGLAGSLLVVAATIVVVAAARAFGHALRVPVMSQNSDEHGGHVALHRN